MLDPSPSGGGPLRPGFFSLASLLVGVAFGVVLAASLHYYARPEGGVMMGLGSSLASGSSPSSARWTAAQVAAIRDQYRHKQQQQKQQLHNAIAEAQTNTNTQPNDQTGDGTTVPTSPSSNVVFHSDAQCPTGGSVDHSHARTGSNGRLRSDSRGHVAVMMTGSPRALSSNFRSHIANLFAGSPYTVHIFLHSWAKDLRFVVDAKTDLSTTFTEKLAKGSNAADRTVRTPNTPPNYSSFSAFRSINATMDYMSGWRNLDNELVCTHESVKGFMVEDLSMEESAARYREQQRHIVSKGSRLHLGDDYGWRLFAMIYSQEQADRMREEYAKEHGIDYLWVVRLRTDTMIRNNLWEMVFKQESLNSRDAVHRQLVRLDDDETNARAGKYDGSLPFRLHDTVYTPVLDRSAIHIPDGTNNGHSLDEASPWHGMNDQFALSSAPVHTAYVRRSSMKDVMDSFDKNISPHFGTEGFGGEMTSYRKMVINKVPIRMLPICYTALRVVSTNRPKTDSHRKSVETKCTQSEPLYGSDVCHKHCGAVQQRRTAAHEAAQRLFRRNSNRVANWYSAHPEAAAAAAAATTEAASRGLRAPASTAPLGREDDSPFIYRVRMLSGRSARDMGIGIGVPDSGVPQQQLEQEGVSAGLMTPTGPVTVSAQQPPSDALIDAALVRAVGLASLLSPSPIVLNPSDGAPLCLAPLLWPLDPDTDVFALTTDEEAKLDQARRLQHVAQYLRTIDEMRGPEGDAATATVSATGAAHSLEAVSAAMRRSNWFRFTTYHRHQYSTDCLDSQWRIDGVYTDPYLFDHLPYIQINGAAAYKFWQHAACTAN